MLSQGFSSSDGRTNSRMAAPTKNSAPIITLSRALTGKAGNNKPTIAPGQSQQTAPATAKTMARILIAIAYTAHSQAARSRSRGAFGQRGARRASHHQRGQAPCRSDAAQWKEAAN